MNDLAWAVVGGVLWFILGGAAVSLMWVLTVFVSGMFAMAEKPVASVTAFITGIILTLGALSLVVYSVIMSIITIVQIATNGG